MKRPSTIEVLRRQLNTARQRIQYLEAQLDHALIKLEAIEEESRIKAQTEHALARRRSYGNGYLAS